MDTKFILPNFIFESSWEVCNKVGGIYTVLSTRAKTLQDTLKDKVVFIGPDFWLEKENSLFTEDKSLYRTWVKQANEQEGLKVRMGRWNIPGKPLVILVDFVPFFEQKNDIFQWGWENFMVDSLHGYGDYDEANMFSFAAGRVVESFYKANLQHNKRVIYQAHEWMTGLGALYVQKAVPEIATIFTTHATTIGRSIAGNHKPLYDYLFAYNGDQMAQELNVQSKHSIEKMSAHHVDCFTTVSSITDNECKELLDLPAAVVLPNGFENDFVPSGSTFLSKRRKARGRLLEVANQLLGTQLDDNTLLLATSGRYEFKNKGIDVYLEALCRLSHDERLKQNVVAFVNVPGWVGPARQDLQERLASKRQFDTPLEYPMLTHWLNDMEHDNVLNKLRSCGMDNRPDQKVKVIFVPCYQDGKDGILNMHYYDLILGNDLSIYPSYYEPWGYTPLESIAFKVPTITTDLAGFGLWANEVFGKQGEIEDGVKVIHRSDYNFDEVANEICQTVLTYIQMSDKEKNDTRKKAGLLAKKALWSNFITYYYKAYEVAFKNAQARLERTE
ncbi:MAG: glycogen/starch synthase [Bacteroidaceae bacterium]|nr:glycogen/starch synthase [Bacteroidaceae bacterium]MCF0186105.1 glycogen/starch synthase [Bacteroidaceae bacterium]